MANPIPSNDVATMTQLAQSGRKSTLDILLTLNRAEKKIPSSIPDSDPNFRLLTYVDTKIARAHNDLGQIASGINNLNNQISSGINTLGGLRSTIELSKSFGDEFAPKKVHISDFLSEQNSLIVKSAQLIERLKQIPQTLIRSVATDETRVSPAQAKQEILRLAKEQETFTSDTKELVKAEKPLKHELSAIHDRVKRAADVVKPPEKSQAQEKEQPRQGPGR